ncbi:MAG: hypothetical protein JXJ04_21810, partial [Spirochaetales bacterium]|nr:hypothetical protein [Spirochaetales bacterium]
RGIFIYFLHMGTFILDKKKVVSLKLPPEQYNVLIRVTNPRSSFLELENDQIYRDILTLQFYDLDDKDSNLYLFNENHLEKILEFFKKHKNCRNMVIHCDEGRSRSAGIAVGWFLFNDVKSSIYKLYHDNVHFPNRRVVEYFFRSFGEPISRIEKWEEELYG